MPIICVLLILAAAYLFWWGIYQPDKDPKDGEPNHWPFD